MAAAGSSHVIGLIADTHGLVRPEVHDALSGVELILHAGDIGGEDVLAELRAIAPVLAVFGNTDPPGAYYPAALVQEIDGVSIHVSHGHELGRPTPEGLLARYAEDVLVFGHTHRADVRRAGKRLVVNPGAAGPRRFDLRPSVARLTIEGGQFDVRIVQLEPKEGR